MSAHALSPRPIDFLPPTLQPHAIAVAAPGTDRRLSFLVACLLYSGLAATLALAARNPKLLQLGQIRTQPIQLVEPTDVLPEPLAATEPVGGIPFTPPMVKAAETEFVPFTPAIVAPDQPSELLNQDLSARPSNTTGIANPSVVGVPPGIFPTTSTQHTNLGGGRPVIVDLEASAIRILHQVQPNYPDMARRARVQGAVLLQMTIDEKGIPTNVRVLSSPHPALEGESLRVARQWRFEPARLDGHAIAAKFNLTLNYLLKN